MLNLKILFAVADFGSGRLVSEVLPAQRAQRRRARPGWWAAGRGRRVLAGRLREGRRYHGRDGCGRPPRAGRPGAQAIVVIMLKLAPAPASVAIQCTFQVDSRPAFSRK